LFSKTTQLDSMAATIDGLRFGDLQAVEANATGLDPVDEADTP
jgi:hypothetical protein